MGELSVQQPRGLQLMTMADFAAFGRSAADSAFVPKEFRGRPADCALAAQYGAEIGLGPLQALQSIAVVNGRPTVWGDTALALVRGSGFCLGVEEGVEGEGDQRVGFCLVHRKGETPQRRTFSVADAKRANLWGKSGPWTQYPDRMLQLRARGFALRDVFPDVLRGLVTREEAADYQVVAEPVVVRPAFPEASKTVDPADDFDRFKAERPISEVVVEIVNEAKQPRGGGLVAKAKGAIEKAVSLEDLDAVRQRIDQHREAKTLSEADVFDLVKACHAKAEAIIAVEEQAADAYDSMQAADAVAEAIQ